MQNLQPNALLQGGRYKIISTLGQGGFGITYLAIQSGLDRRVAIKEFFMKELCNRNENTSHVTLGTESSRDTVTRFREKFLKEARNIAKLKHPNVVSVIDVFEENDTAYYVMEYAEGGSLSDLIKQKGGLSESLATTYILQVADALKCIHKHQMNHLDVKPANIMLDEEGKAILIDFGLSKQYSEGGQQTSTTPTGISEGFAPLEQYNQGGMVDFSPETDIYALGATYYKLLTGLTPPSASDVNENGIPVEELQAKGVSQHTIAIIEKAMQPRKRDRIASAQAFINMVKEDESTVLIASSTSKQEQKEEPEVVVEEANVAAEETKLAPGHSQQDAAVFKKSRTNNSKKSGGKVFIILLMIISGLAGFVSLGYLAYCTLIEPDELYWQPGAIFLLPVTIFAWLMFAFLLTILIKSGRKNTRGLARKKFVLPWLLAIVFSIALATTFSVIIYSNECSVTTENEEDNEEETDSLTDEMNVEEDTIVDEDVIEPVYEEEPSSTTDYSEDYAAVDTLAAY